MENIPLKEQQLIEIEQLLRRWDGKYPKESRGDNLGAVLTTHPMPSEESLLIISQREAIKKLADIVDDRHSTRDLYVIGKMGETSYDIKFKVVRHLDKFLNLISEYKTQIKESKTINELTVPEFRELMIEIIREAVKSKEE